MLGKFHEISVQTADIADFGRLTTSDSGSASCGTTDTWQHPYGVMTDGRLVRRAAPVQVSVAHASPTCSRASRSTSHGIEKLGVEIAWKRVGDDAFNEFGFLDPSGQPVRVQEAPTHFASDRDRGETRCAATSRSSACPRRNSNPCARSGRRSASSRSSETDAPYVRMSMTSDHIDLAVHRARTLDQPMLVFAAADMGERIERLRSLDVAMSDDLPRGLDPRSGRAAARAGRHGAASHQRGRLATSLPLLPGHAEHEDREVHAGEQEERAALRDGIVEPAAEGIREQDAGRRADAGKPEHRASHVTRRFLPEQRLARDDGRDLPRA